MFIALIANRDTYRIIYIKIIHVLLDTLGRLLLQVNEIRQLPQPTKRRQAKNYKVQYLINKLSYKTGKI